MRFLVADSLTGTIVGRLKPHKWEMSDPLRSPGTGSLTVALPDDPDDEKRATATARLAELTQPRKRWVAVQDDLDRFLWCGPIPRTPAQGNGELVIPVQDWRSWFYRTPVRPLSDGTRRSYFRRNGEEQSVIFTDLLGIALDTVGAPRMVVDSVEDTGVEREITAVMLERSIGEHLDDVRDRGGPEWHTYCTQDDATTLLVHVAVAFPERAQRTSPVLLSWKLGKGGTAASYSWPEGQNAPTRVWAYGDGEPPDRVFAVSEFPEIEAGTEVAWEQVIGPLSGVTRSVTAFDHADQLIDRSRGYDGTAEFTVVDEKIPLGDVATGDRARVVLESGWVSVDIEAARIIDSTISGGRTQPLQRVVTVDLADDSYPDDGADPGEAVDE